MPASLILTIVGPDRPGLVNLISDRVTAHGGNWLESRMANLAGQFAGIVHLHVPQASIEALIVAFQELEAQGGAEQQQSGGFLDSMRDAIFGQSQPRGSVPNVPPPEASSRPVWNSGQAMQQSQGPGTYNQPPYGQPYGAPQAPMGGGGSFLGTAAAAAAGVVGGSLLLGSIRSMMGGSHHGFGDAAGLGGGVEDRRPWSDQSGGDLARDAGINDIGSSKDRADDSSRTGLFDSASNDHHPSNDDQASNDDSDDHDDMDLDSDDFGGDGDSDDA